MSGNRMTNELMNQQPTDANFRADPYDVLRTLVVRALHRHINHSVFTRYDLVSTGPMVANTRAVPLGGNTFAKEVMARQFIHNSQRAFWDDRVSHWVLTDGLNNARGHVILALSAV
jgi:hypothetical protein